MHLSDLPKDDPFLYEKTGVSEIAPRPSAFAFELLKKIYADGGPVFRAYKRHQIGYKDTDFLLLVDGQLYVDREREIVSLFPIMGYFRSPDLNPLIVRFMGMRRSVNNFLSFNGLNGKHLTEHRDALRAALEKHLGGNINERVRGFLSDYELVFDVNLIAEKVTKALEVALKGDKLTVNEMIALPADDLVKTLLGWTPPIGLTGNSLDPADVTPFTGSAGLPVSEEAEKKLARIPHWKRRMVLPMIRQVQCYNLMREYGRWLVVKHATGMRPLVANEPSISSPDLPNRLSHLEELPAPKRAVGVSAGTATGVLVLEKDLDSVGDKILVTRLLFPQLVPTLARVKGIVSEQGSALSHLAIVARERGIPIVVNVRLEAKALKLGDRVTIDGSTGEVKKIA